jgi:hypothetical protein
VVPARQELLLVNELRFNQLHERQSHLENHLLLVYCIRFVGQHHAETTGLDTTFSEVHLKQETAACLDLVMHYLRGPHLELPLLGLRPEDDSQQVKQTHSAFVRHSDLAENRVSVVAGDGELPSDIELEAFEDD